MRSGGREDDGKKTFVTKILRRRLENDNFWVLHLKTKKFSLPN